MIINKIYLDYEVLSQIGRAFKNSNPRMIKLDNLLDLKFYNELREKLNFLSFEKTKIPDKYSFSEFKINNEIDIEELGDFINKITEKKNKIKIKLRKYSWKDYKLIHDSENFSGIKFCIFILSEESWDSNNGGSFVFRSKEDYVFSPFSNSFFIIEKKKDMQDFVQYVNNKAGNKCFYVIEGTVFS
ncbi:MAG: hypothetical protein AABY10_01910 [Nanoarchaeota archaeon]